MKDTNELKNILASLNDDSENENAVTAVVLTSFLFGLIMGVILGSLSKGFKFNVSMFSNNTIKNNESGTYKDTKETNAKKKCAKE